MDDVDAEVKGLARHRGLLAPEPIRPDSTLVLLAERGRTHGDFKNVAVVYKALVSAMGAAGGSSVEDPQHDLALKMFCLKMARIICGNPNERDHWKDIGGYARLGEDACKKKA